MPSPHRPYAGETFTSESTASVAPGFGGLLRSRPVVSGDFAALDKWRTKLKNVRAGTANGRLIGIGDSTLGGWPTSLIDRLVPQWSANRLDRTLPGAVYGTDPAKYTESRIVAGSGWVNAGLNSFGPANAGVQMGSPGVSPLTVGPVDCDRFEIFYLAAAAATFDYWIDGGAATTVTVPATAAIPSPSTVTGTVAVGSHTLSIGNVVGGSVFIFAVEPRTGTSGLYVSRCGIGGHNSTQWADASSSFASAILMYHTMKADLWFIMLTTGDVNTQVSLATYRTNLESQIDLAKTYGSVVLGVAPRPTSMPAAYPIKYDQYISVVEAVRDSKGVGLINFANHFDPLDPTLYMEDTLHPSVGAQAEMSLILAQALMP